MRLTVLFTLLLAQTTFLFGNTAISYGTNLQASIDVLGEVDTYTFEGTVGDRIYLRARDAETGIDACFTLLDPVGNIIADPCGNGGIVVVKDYELTLSGTYQILFKDKRDNDTGAYGLSLMKLNSPTYAQPISCDFDATETLTKAVEVKTYTFSATAQDKIFMRMVGVNTSIESEIELYNAAGDLLASDAGSGLSFIYPFEIPETGDYYVLAMDKNGNDLGNFGISLQILNKNNCTEVINCGNNISGKVEHPAQITAYGMYCQTGDKVLFSARNANSSFESELHIYDSAGNLITSTEASSKQQEILSDELDEGFYQIVYLDKGGNDLGEFGISLQVVKGENCCESITCETESIDTELPVLSSMKSFNFEGTAGALVNVNAFATTAGVDPSIRIFNSAGELVKSAFSYQNTRIENFELPNTGEYVVICQDLSGNDLGNMDVSFAIDRFMPVPDEDELPLITLDCSGTVTPPTAQIPCGDQIIGTTTSDLNFAELGEYEITWTYTSDDGSSVNQSQKVVVADNTAPQILCNERIRMPLDENGEFILTEDYIIDFVSDDCSGIASIEMSNQFFNCDHLGENIVTVWVTDRAQNTSVCEFKVALDDSEGNCNSCDPIPNPWSQKDVGNPSLPGSACYDSSNGTFEVTGNGQDIFGYEDQFTFVYQNFCGDADLVAKVKHIDGAEDYAIAGIMMRQSFGPAVRYAGLLATKDNGVYYQARTKPNQYTLYEAHEGAPEIWVKLSRRGNLISGYLSDDGANWVLNCEIQVKLGGCYFAGLVVSSGSSDTYNTGTFENVSLTSVDNRSAAIIGTGSGTNLTILDQCQFQIESRDEEPDCSEEIVEIIEPEIPIYPNPARDYLAVDLNEFAGESIEVRLISRRGNVRYRERFETSPYGLQMDFQSLNVASGVYNLQIISSEGTFSKPIIIVDER